MKIFLLMTLMFTSPAFASDLADIASCVSFCQSGNPECFDMGPAFKPIHLPLRAVIQAMEGPEGAGQAICEDRSVVHGVNFVESEGPPCTVKASSLNTTITIPTRLYGTITSGNSLKKIVLFEAGSSPILLGGLSNVSIFDGEVEFLVRMGTIGVFGLRGENVQRCLAIPID